jgi:FtsZ-interacting cell division protein ZipA
MSSEQIIWILVAIVVVVAIVGVALAASKRRGTAKAEHRRHEAEQLREDAVAGASGLTASRAQAQEARAEAEVARARATEAERRAAMDEATVEDRVREADQVDPDVDHRAEDYQPEAPAPRDAATGHDLRRGDQTTDQSTDHATRPVEADPGAADQGADPDAGTGPRGAHQA